MLCLDFCVKSIFYLNYYYQIITPIDYIHCVYRSLGRETLNEA